MPILKKVCRKDGGVDRRFKCEKMLTVHGTHDARFKMNREGFAKRRVSVDRLKQVYPVAGQEHASLQPA